MIMCPNPYRLLLLFCFPIDFAIIMFGEPMTKPVSHAGLRIKSMQGGPTGLVGYHHTTEQSKAKQRNCHAYLLMYLLAPLLLPHLSAINPCAGDVRP